MSQHDVEIVRRIYDGGPHVHRLIAAGDDLGGDPWLCLWHPQCLLNEVVEVPDASAYVGRAGVVRYFGQLLELWEEVTYAPVEIIDGDRGVLVAVDVLGRSKAGVELTAHVFQVFRLEDGMVIYAKGYIDRDEAFKAAGEEE